MKWVPTWRGIALRAPFYALLPLVLVYLGQDRLLHHPRGPSPTERRAVAIDGLVAWPDLQTYRGWLYEPNPGPVLGTVVLFHGNAGHAAQRRWYVPKLGRDRIRVLLAEHPGYGSRPGDLDEATLSADAAATIRRARAQFGGPLVVVGESLGAGVAAAAVAQCGPEVDGILLVTPWDRLAHVAGHHYPWLPVRWLLRDDYDSVGNLARFSGRAVVVLGSRDEVIPVALGRALADGIRADKRVYEVDSGHGDWHLHVDEAWWRSVVAFLFGVQPG